MNIVPQNVLKQHIFYSWKDDLGRAWQGQLTSAPFSISPSSAEAGSWHHPVVGTACSLTQIAIGPGWDQLGLGLRAPAPTAEAAPQNRGAGSRGTPHGRERQGSQKHSERSSKKPYPLLQLEPQRNQCVPPPHSFQGGSDKVPPRFRTRQTRLPFSGGGKLVEGTWPQKYCCFIFRKYSPH